MKSLLRKLLKSNPVVQPNCPQGSRIYCIGDIHGRDDLLQALHGQILEHAETYTGQKTIIYLGDYIDRGEQSKQVIELLINQPLPGFEHIYLRGNHEQTLLDFLIQPEVGPSWFQFGGLQTLVSYGVRYNKIPTSKGDLQALQEDLRECIPATHMTFLEKTRISLSAGSYYFVHAGVNPRIALEQQVPEDLLWIRGAFVEHEKPFEKIIVHGHTITEEPDFQDNRIGIDTGAYLSGKLSCLVLEDDKQYILQSGIHA